MSLDQVLKVFQDLHQLELSSAMHKLEKIVDNLISLKEK